MRTNHRLDRDVEDSLPDVHAGHAADHRPNDSNIRNLDQRECWLVGTVQVVTTESVLP